MTDIDKGRLLMTESKKAVRAQQLVLWLGGIAPWCAMPLLFIVQAHLAPNTPGWDLVAYFVAHFLLLTGVFFAVMALSVRPLHLHENGVDNLQVGFSPRVFKRFDEIERVDVRVKGDWAAIIFWTRGRWRRISNSMVLKEEDRQRWKLRKIVELLRFKGMKVSLVGKTEEWFREE